MASDSRCHSPACTVNEETTTLLSSLVSQSTCLRLCVGFQCDRNHTLLSFSSGLIGLIAGIMFAYLFFPSFLKAQDFDRPLSYSKG